MFRPLVCLINHFYTHFLDVGIRPPPYSWRKWNFKLLEPANIRELQDDRTQSLKGKHTYFFRFIDYVYICI